ncbi:MAG: acyl-CoA dehydrogenase family protein [Myxococcota bacterium]|nr:acyl-CoA dehydrogenase family protein [Myxococcota bacterium]
MQFELDEDRALLKQSTRELLEKEAPLSETRAVMEDTPEGFSKPFHAQLGELGYPGLLLPEDDGGMGALAFAAVLAEMGRVALPGPFLDLALGVRTLSGCDHEAAARLGERARAGEALVVMARLEDPTRSDPDAPEARFEAGRVRGTKTFVPFGAHADALLVTTREGLALVERPGAGFSATPLPTIDHAQRFAEIAIDEPAELVAEGEAAARLIEEHERLGALGASAGLLGLMERALEITVAYISEREAFGVPIGSLQVLQHRAADMLMQVESSRSAVYRAAWSEEQEPETAAYLTAVAKAWAGAAARYVCGQAIQLHGGVGYTWEYDPHIFLKRTKTLESFYGSTRAQLGRALALRQPTL